MRIKIDQHDQRKDAAWLTADEALARLAVRPQTLYAYASRGRVTAAPDPADPRRSRYLASDVAALAGRRALGRKRADVAERAIAWGEPVLASAITCVVGGRLYYRGEDAVGLAETQTLEGVARLLRGGGGEAGLSRLRPPPPRGATMRARALATLAARADTDPPLKLRSPSERANDAATLMDVFADAILGEVGGGAIHARLARAWGCGLAGMDLLRRALVLLADHELNASTFAARVAASTGASLSAAALAGLATLTGPLHGGAHEHLARLADEARRIGPDEAVAARLAFNPSAPGFGHPLYPDGDPRARALFRAFEPPASLVELRSAITAATGARDNVDFALLALAETLALPEGAAFMLFAMARMAGWLAHALEQAEVGELIRPRARYLGPPPRNG